MRPPKKNRFQARAGELEAASAGVEPTLSGGNAMIDADGVVTYEGEQPLEVRILGRVYSFEPGTHLVQVGRVAYQLVRQDGRERLIPVGL